MLASYPWVWEHGSFPGVWLIYPVLLNQRKLICLLPAAIVCEQLRCLWLGFCLACLACHWTLNIFFSNRWVISIETNNWTMFGEWDFRVTSPEQDVLFIPSLKTQGPLQKRGLERHNRGQMHIWTHRDYDSKYAIFYINIRFSTFPSYWTFKKTCKSCRILCLSCL